MKINFKIKQINKYLLLLSLCILLSGCTKATEKEEFHEVNNATVNNTETVSVSIINSKELKVYDDVVPFNENDSFSFCEQPLCYYNKDTKNIDFTIVFSNVPDSDDSYIYLFEMSGVEDDTSFDAKPYVASELKDKEVTLSFPYNEKYLFSRFVPAIVYEKNFYPLSLGQYITNPEDISVNTTPYPEIESKKGLLLDPLTINKEELTDLNVKRLVFNIPLSFIMGQSDNEMYPTINYEYFGNTYYFDGYKLAGFDSIFKYLTENNYHVTAIVLNDQNKVYPEIIHPLSRNKTKKSMYYAFNTTSEEGIRLTEAAALFLSERYSGNECGLIHDWVIANEINQQKIWNYMATDDLNLYTESFERSFRIFYNAIKSNYSNANVYFSIDHDWNNNGGANYRHFNGKDILNTFNNIAKSRGNYDWALSIHPYPSPLTNTSFWNGYSNKYESAKIITPMNLSVITDFMRQDDFLDTNKNVRLIGVTELGFSSKSGERMQAAAFAYCYYIIENNEYINSFLMNRQTDSYDSLKSGLALGIYNPDYSRKYITNVFANIDTENGEEYIKEMLKTIGAKSLDEALARAK